MFYCATCGREYAFETLIWRCACGGPLDWRPLVAPRWSRDQIDRGEASTWRYEVTLPLARSQRKAFLGEGWTPLLAGPEPELLLKCDFLCPTGSFKDRGSTILMNY